MPVETKDCQEEHVQNSFIRSSIKSNITEHHGEQTLCTTNSTMQRKISFGDASLSVALNAAVSSVSSTSSAYSSGDSNSQNTGLLMSSPNEMHSIEESVTCSATTNSDSTMIQTMAKQNMTFIDEQVNNIRSVPDNNCDKSILNCNDSTSCLEQIELTSSDANHNLQTSLTNESELSVKSSPISNKTIGQELDSPDSAEIPSMPSDKSDSHGNSDGRGLELGEEITPNSLTGEPDPADVYTKSLHIKTDSPSLTVESPAEPTGIPYPQTETMASLENTIDSVLELIRTGREMEVEFNAVIRQQPQEQPHTPHLSNRQMYSQSTSHPMSASGNATPNTHNFSSGQSPRQMINSQDGRRESSSYLARQRIQSALDQATSSYYGGLSSNSGLSQEPSRPSYSKHLSGQPSSYATPMPHTRYPSHPSINPNVLGLQHQPMYMPSYTRAMPVRSQYPVLHQHQQYRHHSPGFTGYSSGQGNPQGTTVGTSYYSPPLLSPGTSTVRPFMHSRFSHAGNLQQLSPSSSTSPRAVNLPIGNPSTFRDQSGKLISFPPSRHYSPNFSESSGVHHLSFPSAPHKKSGQSMHSAYEGIQTSYSPNSIPQQRFPPELYHNSPHQIPTMTKKSQLMPPPMASVTTPGKKRKMSFGKPSDSKRKRTDKSFIMESSCQQMYTEHFLEETLKRLSMTDFPSLVQDPLVTPSISLLPPRGGRLLCKIINGAEAEKDFNESESAKKYNKSPYILRHPKPQDQSECKVNNYLLQAIPDLKPPERPILLNHDKVSFSCRSSTPDNPIPGTPEPVDVPADPMLAMLNNFPSSKHEHFNGRTTPPLPMMYPLIFSTCFPSGRMTNTKLSVAALNYSENKLIHEEVTEPGVHKLVLTATHTTNENGIPYKSELNMDSNDPRHSKQSSKSLIARMLLANEISMKKPHASSKNRTSSQSRYFEESVTMTSLVLSKKQSTCRHCEMHIDRSQSITRKLSELMKDFSHQIEQDKIDQPFTFCSVNCLTQFSQIRNGVNGFDFDEVLESFTQSSKSQSLCNSADLQVPVLLQGRLSKFAKVRAKRQLSFDRLAGKKLSNQHENGVSSVNKPILKRWRGVRWRKFDPNLTTVRFYKEIPNGKMRHILSKYSSQLRCSSLVKDTRTCLLCQTGGDSLEEVAGRLLNYGVDIWLHLNCALWCFDAYETVSGALLEVIPSVDRALKTMCVFCGRYGAGISCFRSRCPAVYHLPCAHDTGCMFFTDRGMYCPTHRVKDHPLHLPQLTAERRVYINRNESDQVASVVLDEGKNAMSLRIGSVILHQVGQLLPEQLSSGSFNSKDCIYPIGYRASRYYWSSRHVNKRILYECSVDESCGKPLFVVSVQEPGFPLERHEDTSCTGAWCVILQRISDLRKEAGLIKLFPQCLQGDYLFGLSESHIVRAIESLPGVECLKNYVFKFGRMQLITEMPLAINPTGCVRSESKLRTYVRRSHCPVRHATNSNRDQHVKGPSELTDHGPSFSRFVSGKTQQYRRLKYDWKYNVTLGRSRIQGLGLFAAREIEKFTFIIEYLGEVIRNEVANRREQLYESQNRGVYMFRVDDDYIVDATMCGGLARYVNHSCEPNCSAEIVTFDGSSHILILANKKVEKGEELTYDYNFDYEDCSAKIPCLCGASSCRNWMN